MTTEQQARSPETADGAVTVEKNDNVLLIGIDRPAKRNALTPALLTRLGEVYEAYESDDALRCAVLFGHGPVFCAGADLNQLKDAVDSSDSGASRMDPFQMAGRMLSKPLVVAVHGACVAAGLELALAGDIIVAAQGTKFGQPETQRGIFAFGGGSVRWPLRVGWGNAQRYLLTGELLDAQEAWRIGLVQEVVPAGAERHRAVALAASIASSAPLGVRDTLAVGRRAVYDGPSAAFEEQARRRPVVMRSADAAEGIASFVERRPAEYSGT
jgi:enoyl-CoA hydratase